MSVKRDDIRGTAIKGIVDNLKSKPCMDCGGSFPPEAMDYDHRPGEEKISDIGKLVGGRYSLDKIEAEIAKCDLVCSNCHRIRSKKRLNDDGLPPFLPMPKIHRFNREVVVTEKIDGTSAVVVITECGDVLPGSKSRWLRPKLSKMGPDPDNFGFAAWVEEHDEELFEGLGPGVHRGEWFGDGIQRGYGLTDRRFALFNVARWGEERDLFTYPLPPPACCSVVPVIWRGTMEELNVPFLMATLAKHGSYIADFPDPEGIVLHHVASGTLWKRTLKNDDTPKSLVQ